MMKGVLVNNCSLLISLAKYINIVNIPLIRIKKIIMEYKDFHDQTTI